MLTGLRGRPHPEAYGQGVPHQDPNEEQKPERGRGVGNERIEMYWGVREISNPFH